MTSVIIYLNATSSKTIKVKYTWGVILGELQRKQSTWSSPVRLGRRKQKKQVNPCEATGRKKGHPQDCEQLEQLRPGSETRRD